MKVPQVPRWTAPVLIVVFVLTSVWAGYNVSRVAAAQSTGPTGPTVDYAGAGAYRYTAELLPNSLFNSTTVSGTNLTLFSAITKTINVTVASSATFSRAASGGLYDVFTVQLVTAAWTKTVERTTQSNSSLNTTDLSVADDYEFNVSQTSAFVAQLDSELNYSATSFTVRLTSAISAGVALEGSASSFAVTTSLNLTFRGALIVPTGSSGRTHGSFTAGAAASDPPSTSALVVGWVGLAASLAALAGSVWLFWVDRRVAGPAPVPPLDRLIEPYEEVIARTTRVPEGARVVPVDRWDDLVKVADTIGRPILRPIGSPTDTVGRQFYVFDGTVAYLYQYPGPAPPARATPAPTVPPRAPGPPPVAVPVAGVSPWVAAPRAPAPVPTPYPRAPSAETPRAAPAVPLAPAPKTTRASPVTAPAVPRSPATRGTLAQQLKEQLGRIRTAPLEPAQRWYIFSQFSQAVHTVSSASPEVGQRAVDGLREAIDRALARPPGPGTS